MSERLSVVDEIARHAVTDWTLRETEEGLRLIPGEPRRKLGSERFSWMELLYGRLGAVRVFVLFFPSRFDQPTDMQVMEALRRFGSNTPPDTSVNFWDPRDPEFGRGLDFFGLTSPPALVLVSGLLLKGADPYGPAKANAYAVTIAEQRVLADPAKVSSAVNTVHEIVRRAEPKEISSYLRAQSRNGLLQALGRISAKIRDQFLKLNPKLLLPDGTAFQIGSGT